MVLSVRANGYLFLYKVLKIEERAKKIKLEIRLPKYQMVALIRKKMAWQLIGK